MSPEPSPKNVAAFRVPAVRFVGEQDGPPERLLKDRLCELFRQDKAISPAYLARADIGGPRIGAITDYGGRQIDDALVRATGSGHDRHRHACQEG